LRKLATFKGSVHEKSLVKLLLAALVRRWREVGGVDCSRKVGDNDGKEDGISRSLSKVSLNDSAESLVLNDGINAGGSEHRIPVGELTGDVSSGPTIPTDSVSSESTDQHANASTTINNSETLPQLPDPLSRSTADPSITPPTWKDFAALQSHLSDWDSETVKDWAKIKAFAVKMVQECAPLPLDVDLNILTEDDVVKDIGDVIMHLFSKIESNGFGVWAPGGREGGDTVCAGRAVFPHASFFNHSCAPTCECIRDGHFLYVKTLKPVKKDEELTISYINVNLPLLARRSQLKQDYFFDCACLRCITEEKSKPGKREKVTFERSFKRAEGTAKRKKEEKKEKRMALAAGKNKPSRVVVDDDKVEEKEDHDEGGTGRVDGTNEVDTKNGAGSSLVRPVADSWDSEQ
ncbi:hypothetical protein HDU76_012835, partial [Blyttiomyces sp. JEL0837]